MSVEMQKIRVLEMIDRPFLGGGQVNLLSIARNLDRDKFDVYVSSREGGPLVADVRKSGIAHFPVSLDKKINRAVLREISSILKVQAIDIVHTHGGVAGFYGRWAGHKSGIPVIVHTLHGIHYLHYRNPLLKRVFIYLERIFSRFTDALILVSDGDRKKATGFRLAPESKIHVIKNGIGPASQKEGISVEQKKRELGLDLSQPIVGTLARLHRQKGIAYLIQASKRISQVIPQVKVLIVGEGPLKEKLERSALRAGLEDILVFMGERTDASEILSLFDVFVLPSLWEGLPYVLIEASAAGKPIVATDVDGVREIIKNGDTGILVPPRNPEKLSEAVIRLLQNRDYASKLGEKAMRLIPPQFTLSRMVKETEELYLKLLRAKIKT